MLRFQLKSASRENFETVGIWNLTLQNLENLWNPDLMKIIFQMVQFSKGGCKGYRLGYGPDQLKTAPFEIRAFLSRFQMIFDK